MKNLRYFNLRYLITKAEIHLIKNFEQALIAQNDY